MNHTIRVLALIGLAAIVGGCQAKPLTLVVSPRPVPQLVAAEIVQLNREHDELDDFTIEVTPGAGALANLEAVAAGDADLAIVPNSVEFRPGVRTVAVLYTGVLHALYRRPEPPRDFAELVSGAKIYAGPDGSVERWLLSSAAESFALTDADYRIVDSLHDADVIFMFTPILQQLPAEVDDDWRFFSIGDPRELGHGAPVEALSLRYPQLQPFLIPARTYPRLDHPAVLTASVDMLLVAREDLDEDLVLALTRALVEHRRQLAEASPALFSGVRGEPAVAPATFALHEGARRYFDRDLPGFAERYAELAGVMFSVLVTTVTGLVALSRWRDRRRKDRIDVYYAEAWAIRNCVHELDEQQRDDAVARLRALEARAFEALIAEQLAADEAFQIFVALVNDTVRDLRAEIG